MATIRIVSYAPDRKAGFIRRSAWWIERSFDTAEPRDQAESDRIDQEPARGGMIFFAPDEQGHALATCIARSGGKGIRELAKLGSDSCLPHPGTGTAAFRAAETWTSARGARCINILKDSSLHAAKHIYESHGFRRFGLPPARIRLCAGRLCSGEVSREPREKIAR